MPVDLETLSTFELTEAVFNSLYHPGDDTLLTPEEADSSGVTRMRTALTKNEQLYVNGDFDGRDAYQTLSMSQRTGHFYLATVFMGDRGPYELRTITPRTPIESRDAVASSFFMQAISAVQAARHSA